MIGIGKLQLSERTPSEYEGVVEEAVQNETTISTALHPLDVAPLNELK